MRAAGLLYPAGRRSRAKTRTAGRPSVGRPQQVGRAGPGDEPGQRLLVDGMTVRRFVILSRVQAAAHELTHTDRSVTGHTPRAHRDRHLAAFSPRA